LTCFLEGIGLRENCYSCNYARPERISDITIGDFIGLGSEIPFAYSPRNVSSVFINTEQGERAYDDILKIFPDLASVERNYSERLKYGPSLRYPFERSPYNKKFKEKYIETGDFDKAMNLSYGRVMAMKKIKFVLSIPKKIVGKIFK